MARFMGRSIDRIQARFDAAPARTFSMNPRGYVWLTQRKDTASTLFSAFSSQADSLGIHPIRSFNSIGPKSSSSSNILCIGSTIPSGVDIYHGQSTVQHQFPFVSDSVVAALHARRCGWLDAQQFGTHLVDLAKAAGVKFVQGSVTSVDTLSGKISAVAVRTHDQSMAISTPRFVNAAGPYAPAIGRLVKDSLPVHNEFHAKAMLRDSLNVIPDDCPMIIAADDIKLQWTDEEHEALAADPQLAHLVSALPSGLHFRPSKGYLIMLWDFMHADLRVPSTLPAVASESLDAPIDVYLQQHISPLYPEIIVRGLSQFVPRLSEYLPTLSSKTCHVDAGLYTRTRENLPLIGPSASGISGSFVCTAFSGFGIMAAEAAGELLTAHVCDDKQRPEHLSRYARDFLPSRYADPEYVRRMEAHMSEPSPIGGQL
jgi:glycine/D-amino acid oxidase-like deaminating enzyme